MGFFQGLKREVVGGIRKGLFDNVLKNGSQKTVFQNNF